MAIFASCYQLTIPFSAELLGKVLEYTEPDGYSPTQVSLENLNFTAEYGPGETIYYFCSSSSPTLYVFGQFANFSDYNLTLTGGTTSCTSHSDCAPSGGGGGGGGGGSANAYCYQINIDTGQVNPGSVSFQYTPYAAPNSTVISAQNWATYSTSNGILTLYVCSSSYPSILISGELVFDPSQFGIVVSTDFLSCTNDNACAPNLTPVNCTLSNWGYGATQESWVEGEWSPCSLINGSYQRYQTRYVITPAINGGTCSGATIQYESCTPTPTGSTATLTTPTASSIASTSATISTTISNNGGSPVTSVLFKLYKNGTQVDSKILNDQSGQYTLGISVQFTGLIASSAYTVTASATNSTGTSTTGAGSFNTTAQGGLSTPAVSAITQSGATIASTLTNNGGTIYDRYGVVYKLGNATGLTVDSPGVVNVEAGLVDPGQTTSNLSAALTGLASNTQYYLKFYVREVESQTYVYSDSANFTTSAVSLGVNLVQLSVESVALQGSAGSASSYNFITVPSNNLNRTYVSTIRPSEEDPTPGAYKLKTTLQQVDPAQSQWTILTKTGPGESNWTLVTQTMAQAPQVSNQPSGWSFFEYDTSPHIVFRPSVSGYYKFNFRGRYLDNTQFSVDHEIIIGTPTEDLELSYGELRQGVSSNLQVGALPPSQVWIPEFSEDSLYGITVVQSGSTIIPTLSINNAARSFSAIWGINPANLKIQPTLAITYTSPFKNANLSNTFSKNFPITVLAPYPVITFSTPSIFSNPISSGGTATIGVNTLYADSYTITSSLGNGTANNPVTYTNIQSGTYTITATATNGSGPDLQSVSITGTLTVQAAAPTISQLPQQVIGRNIFKDINMLPFINLNGSSFSNLEIVNQPTNGIVTLNNYIIRYIPNLDYTGTDLFSFRVKSLANTFSNTINVTSIIQAPSFTVGTANETIVFNSTEVGETRDLTVPITNNGTSVVMKISEITLDQDSTDFKLVTGTGQNETIVTSIQNIDINPGNSYSVKIRVEPSAIGVRTAKLKINHN